VLSNNDKIIVSGKVEFQFSTIGFNYLTSFYFEKTGEV
jgi:hypothetical protein